MSPDALFPDGAHAHALTVTTRLASRQPVGRVLLERMVAGRLDDLIDAALKVAVETGEPLGAVLAERFAVEGSAELAEWLALTLAEDPYRSVWPLHELGLLATRRFLDRCRQTWTAPGPREREIVVALVHNAGARLIAVGRPAEALPYLEEALALYDELVPQSTTRNARRIDCLGTCGEALTRLGRLPAALDRTVEAAAGCRAEVATAGAEQLPAARLALAGQLINLCGCLADVDRHGDALTAIDEAVALFRHDHPAVAGLSQALARALLCRGNQLHHLERHREAAEALEEAIAVARELDDERTTAFEPDLALALADLALLYEQLGRAADARQALGEAIRRYQGLEERHPASFRPQLAWSLSLLSPDLPPADPDGRQLSSRAVRATAVEHARELADHQPAVFGPQLAQSLFHLSESLLAEGDARAALAACNEAVTRLRRPPAGRRGRERQVSPPDRRNLAWSLLLRGRIRGALGHRRKALADSREAVALFRQRSAEQAAFYRIDLALALHLLGIRHHELGQFAEAIAVTREAVALYEPLAAAAPEALGEDLAACLNSLSHHLYEAGALEESVAALEQSIALDRQLLPLRPAVATGLAASLTFLAARRNELYRSAEALAPAEEAVEIYRRAGGPPAELAAALLSLGSVLLALGRPAEALPHLAESVELRRPLAAGRSLIHQVDLACSLVSLGKGWSDLGRYREALRATRQGARLLRRAVARGNDFLRPRLAMTLSNEAHQLRALGRPGAALPPAEESLRLLLPSLRENPDRYSDWMALAAHQVLAAAEEAGQDADISLLGEVALLFVPEPAA